MTSSTTSWLSFVADDVVLIDTDVWSMLFTLRNDRRPEVTLWRRLLVGRMVAIAAQTEAELRYGAEIANWGHRRVAALESQLLRTPTLPVTPAVISAYATVKSDCRRQGHAMHEKKHTGDAWIAATACAYTLPLLSGDGIYRGVPGLILLDQA